MLSGDLSLTKFIKDANGARPSTKPREGERTMRQRGSATAWGPLPATPCGSYRSIDGATTITDQCAYPYWYMLLWGSEPVYRLMLQHDTVQLARYIVTGPVRASAWDMTWDDSISEGDPAIQWVKDNILPLRRKVIREAVRCVDFGWQPFSLRWEIRDGMYVPEPRPLLPDATTVLQDDNGKFAGIENQGDKGKPVRLNDLESWVPSLDGEAGYPYGRSRLENIRTTAWAPWLEAYMRFKELEQKISGIVPIVKHPPNGHPDDEGAFINYATEANTILSELPRGRGVRVESAFDMPTLMEMDPQFAVKLAELKIFDIDFLDAGNVAPAMGAFTSAMEYFDKKLFRGMLRPERAGLEAVAAGSRADSEQHTETGAADSEAIDADLTESFDEHVVRTALRLNFGEEKSRKIHVISTPLLKWKQQIFREMFSRLTSIPEIAVDIWNHLDGAAMFSQLSLPALKKAFVDVALAKTKPTDPEAPSNGSNGTGRMKAQSEAELKMAAEAFADAMYAKMHPRISQ